MYQLNKEQNEAVESSFKPIYVIAGAGTGKTQTIAHRVKHFIDNGINPEKILAITFTRKSTEELNKRISKIIGGNGIENVFTFHGFFKNSLETLTEKFKNLRIISEGGKKWLIRKILKDLKIKNMSDEKINEIDDNLKGLKRIESNEDLFEKTINHLSDESSILERSDLIEIYNNYCDFLENNGFFDFDDLEIKINELLDTDEEFRMKLREKFDAILIDEFQDTSVAQFEIVKKITNENSNIFFVGDPDQSIYEFRGTIKDSDKEFKKYYKNGEIITLEQNYRSTVPILETANKLIKNNYKNPEDSKKLWTNRVGGDKVFYKEFSNCDEERVWVMDEIFHLNEKLNIPLEKIAVLYRNYNKFVREFEKEIGKRYKWKVNNSKRKENFKEKWIRFIIAILFVLLKDEVSIFYITDIIDFINKFNDDYVDINEKDIEKFYDTSKQNKYSFTEAIQNIESYKMSKEAIEEFKSLGEKIILLRDLERIQIDSWMEEIIHELNCIDAKDIKDNYIFVRIKEFMKKIKNKHKRMDKIEILMNILTYEENNGFFYKEESEGLNLSTIHASKGLEYNYVFLVNMVDGILPSDEEDSTEEEERRLTYVAFTRAKDKLTISFSPLKNKKNESVFIGESKDPKFFFSAIS